MLTIKIGRNRIHSENITVSNFDEKNSREFTREDDPRVELANGGFDMPLSDIILYRMFYSREDYSKIDSVYPPEEIRIYEYLAGQSVNPVDVNNFLKETCTFKSRSSSDASSQLDARAWDKRTD